MSEVRMREISGEDAIKMILGAITAEETNREEHECDCDNCDKKEFCDGISESMKEEVESNRESSFPEFMKMILKDIKEKVDESELTYNFIEMVDEFDNGYRGTFISEEGDVIRYDIDSKTLLIVTENAVFPASIDSHFVNLEFKKKKSETINGPKALEMAIAGNKVFFTVDMFGTEATGYITSKDGVPGFAITEASPGIRPEIIVIMALFKGTWTLE
jgi:hypothetical protein